MNINEENIVKISIIVPIYKVEEYLPRCIDSILAQTFTDFELILVDDGSPDNCGKICDEYAEKDARIRVIHKENGGLSDARNAGIEASCGEYLMFVDSDDWVDENYAYNMLENILSTESDIAICGLNCAYPSGEIKHISTTIDKDEIITPYEACRRMTLEAGWHYVSVCNKIFRKTMFQTIRFPIRKLHEDVFVAHRLYFESKQIGVITKPLYFYSMREGSITHKKMNIHRAINCFEHEVDRYLFYRSKKLKDLQSFYFKSIYSKTLQVIELTDRESKPIVRDVLRQSLRILKFNPRSIICILKYCKKVYLHNNN